VNTFGDWLLVQLEEKKWSQADLARAAGVSRAAISDIISGRRNVGTELATSIADALNYPADQVFRVAGLLPLPPKPDAVMERIAHEASDLTPAEKNELLAYIQMKKNLRGRK